MGCYLTPNDIQDEEVMKNFPRCQIFSVGTSTELEERTIKLNLLLGAFLLFLLSVLSLQTHMHTHSLISCNYRMHPCAATQYPAVAGAR